MRRGPFGAIVLSLALLMQLVAPGLAARSMAEASFGLAAVCADSASVEDAGGSRSDGVPPHYEHCGLCQLACGTAGLIGFLGVWILLTGAEETLVETGTLEDARRIRLGIDQHEVSRGPPHLA
jgi:hypothetical protein